MTVGTEGQRELPRPLPRMPLPLGDSSVRDRRPTPYIYLISDPPQPRGRCEPLLPLLLSSASSRGPHRPFCSAPLGSPTLFLVF